jgi:HK97 family phage major capsid protein
MPLDHKDMQDVKEAFQAKFDEFKSANDKRLEAVTQEKAALAGKVETLNEKLSEFETYKKKIEDEILALKRPDSPANSTEAKAHAAAFNQFLRKGREDGLRELEHKALSIAVDADGGYAVPELIDRNIVSLQRNISPMRSVCNQVTVGTSDYKQLVNLHGSSSGWVGETDARPATNTPKLGQCLANMGEIYANPQASQVSLDDVFFNAEIWLAEEIAREFDEQEGAAFLTGNGTNKPKGILSYTLAATSDASRAFGTIEKLHSGTAGDFTADNVIKLIYMLKAGYRKTSQWMMPTLTLFKVRTFKDTTNNYLWKPGLEAGQNSTLCGYGIAENEDMPAVASAANAVIFGDFKRAYTIVDRFGVRVLRDPFSNKPNVGFYSTKRVGGMLVDSQAVKVLTLSV